MSAARRANGYLPNLKPAEPCRAGGALGARTYLLKESVALAALLSPRETFETLYQLLAQNELTTHTLTTLKRVPIGLAIGASRLAESSTSGAFRSCA